MNEHAMSPDEIAAIKVRNAEVLRTQERHVAPPAPRRLNRKERRAAADRRYFEASNMTEEGRHILADPAATEPVFENPYTPVAAIAAIGPTMAYMVVKHMVRRHKAKAAGQTIRQSEEAEIRRLQLEKLRKDGRSKLLDDQS